MWCILSQNAATKLAEGLNCYSVICHVLRHNGHLHEIIVTLWAEIVENIFHPLMTNVHLSQLKCY